jgi:hypothetical protein
VYYGSLGEHASHLVDYLGSCPNVAPLPQGANPATWMLEVTGGSMTSGGGQTRADVRHCIFECVLLTAFDASHASQHVPTENHTHTEAELTSHIWRVPGVSQT